MLHLKIADRFKPLLRFRPNPKKQINQGQITIQESAQFDGQNEWSKLCSCIFKIMDIFKLIGIVTPDRKAARFVVKLVGSRLAARFTLELIARGSAWAQGGFHHEEPEQLSEL